MFLTTSGARLPAPLRALVAAILHYGLGETVLSRLIKVSRPKSVSEVQAWRVKKQAYEKQVRAYVSLSPLLFYSHCREYHVTCLENSKLGPRV